MSSFSKKTLVTMIAVVLAGCATTQQGGYAGGSRNECSVGKSTAAGAIVGALIGAAVAGESGAVKGAALGGAAGAAICVGINAKSRQTRTAQQVRNDYLNQGGKIQREPQVVSYQTSLDRPMGRRGEPFIVRSNIEVVDGTANQVRDIREEIEVISQATGRAIPGAPKSPQINAAGGFENEFEITIPANVSQGVYEVRTKLFVNNILTQVRTVNAQLALGETGVVVFQ